MMNRALLSKCVHEAQLLLLGTVTVLFAFCWLRVWIVSLLPMERFMNIVEQFKEFERFMPVPFEQLFTYSGRIALTYDEFIVVMCVTVWAIGRGSDSVSGELGRGTMEMLLSQPVSRLQVLAHQASVTIVGLAVLSLAVWLGVCCGVATTTVAEAVPLVPTSPLTMAWQLSGGELPTVRVPMSSRVGMAVFLPATFNLFSLGFCLAGLSTLMSSWDRYRWRTIGIVAAIYVVQLILKIAGLATDSLAWLLKLTFFTAYDPERFVSVAVHTPQYAWSFLLRDASGQPTGLGPLGFNAILLGIGALAYAGGAWIFSRRDLPAPL